MYVRSKRYFTRMFILFHFKHIYTNKTNDYKRKNNVCTLKKKMKRRKMRKTRGR